MAPVARKQTTLTVPEESDSESENVPPTVTSTPVKSKTTAITLKTTSVYSRNMVTGVLSDSTNLGKKKTPTHRPQSLPPNDRPSISRIQFAPQRTSTNCLSCQLCQRRSQRHHHDLMVSPKNSSLKTYSETI